MGVYSWAVGILHADCTTANSIRIPWLTRCLCSGWSGTSRILCKLELSICMVNYIRTDMHTYIYTRKYSLNLNSDTMEPEWQKQDCPLPVLLQSSILLPSSTHYTFIPARKNSVLVSKMLLYFIFYLFTFFLFYLFIYLFIFFF